MYQQLPLLNKVIVTIMKLSFFSFHTTTTTDPSPERRWCYHCRSLDKIRTVVIHSNHLRSLFPPLVLPDKTFVSPFFLLAFLFLFFPAIHLHLSYNDTRSDTPAVSFSFCFPQILLELPHHCYHAGTLHLLLHIFFFRI